ncbi:patatin-like phospholipase family protein [Mucilaginibacter sp.]|uniref:patatin-like phospholipase family protein n=1 Tax=Mucilaginibacter sp. TaxID=1882438 RepID=UPI0025F898FF|nr:patatin-like phospholipase family protein [Mucilaginibacter sp.]
MKQNISLVLSGGGARGIAHIGVIEELERQGFNIISVAGTSMGAVVGGVYALGQMEAYKSWLYTLDKLKVFGLIDFSFSAQGMVKGDKLFNTIKAFINDANIEDLNIPYAAVAADIINKKEVVFTEGSIYDAIRASIAIPTVFTPVKYADGLLVDGGIINNLPIEHVKRQPGDILVAVNVNAMIPVDKPVVCQNVMEVKHSLYRQKIKDFYRQLYTVKPPNHEEKLGYFNVINKTLNLMTYHTTKLALEKYSPNILVNISHEYCSTYDFYKAEEMVEAGRYAAKNAIDAYKEGLD